MPRLTFLSVLFGIAILHVASSPISNSRTVKTTSGTYQGHPAPHRSDVDEYLGIRWGKPPTGPLRFAPPEKFISDKRMNASEFPLNCPALPGQIGKLPGVEFTEQARRIMSYFVGYAGQEQGEDCLGLNVWTKRGGAKKKPVMVFFYGGEFRVGGTNNPFQYGQYLADAEDVIVVTPNYRIGIFGFSGAPGTNPNAGLLDIRVAMEWVRDNIEAFGGDPSRITMFGQSAGGIAMDYYSYVYGKDPIASGFIFESGQATTLQPNLLNTTEAGFRNVSKALGCGDGSGMMECVRRKDYNQVLTAVKNNVTGGTLAPTFQPTVDGKLVFSNYDDLGDRISHTPSLIGNNDYEPGFFKIELAADKTFFDDKRWDLYGAKLTTCRAAQAVQARYAQKIPTWQYRYFGEFENLQLYRGDGAWHGSELPLVMGTSEAVTGITPSKQEQVVSRYMMHVWATFARDPVKGLTRLGWPLFEPSKPTLGRLAYDNNPGVDFVEPSVYEAVCSQSQA